MAVSLSMLLAATAGLIGLGAGLALVVRHLRWSGARRLERRYWARWERLGETEKRQVLRRLGVVLWQGHDEDPAYVDARLDDLFRSVLAAGGRELGLTRMSGSTLALALLDVEVDWAFAPVARAGRLL